jgi:hypothetical protein
MFAVPVVSVASMPVEQMHSTTTTLIDSQLALTPARANAPTPTDITVVDQRCIVTKHNKCTNIDRYDAGCVELYYVLPTKTKIPAPAFIE